EDEVEGRVACLGCRISAQEEGPARRIGHDPGRERLEGGEGEVPMDSKAEGNLAILFGSGGDFEGHHLSHEIGLLSFELAHGTEDRVERDTAFVVYACPGLAPYSQRSRTTNAPSVDACRDSAVPLVSPGTLPGRGRGPGTSPPRGPRRGSCGRCLGSAR